MNRTSPATQGHCQGERRSGATDGDLSKWPVEVVGPAAGSMPEVGSKSPSKSTKRTNHSYRHKFGGGSVRPARKD